MGQQLEVRWLQLGAVIQEQTMRQASLDATQNTHVCRTLTMNAGIVSLTQAAQSAVTDSESIETREFVRDANKLKTNTQVRAKYEACMMTRVLSNNMPLHKEKPG